MTIKEIGILLLLLAGICANLLFQDSLARDHERQARISDAAARHD